MPRFSARHAVRATVIGTVGAALLSTAGLLSTGLASAATPGSLQLVNGKSAYASTPKTTKSSVTRTFTVPSTSARPVRLGLQFRSPKKSVGYRTRAVIGADGSVRVGITRVRKGKEKVLLTKKIGLTVKQGDKLSIQGSVTGKKPVSIKVRAWLGSTKPAWQKKYSDKSSARIKTGTKVRAWGFLSGDSAASTAAVSFSSVVSSPPAPAASPTGPTAATPADGAPAVGVKPTASSTGPTSSELPRHDGNITVTKAGTVIEGMDIHGFVNVKAANVVIRNSIVRGGPATGNIGLITNYGYDNLLVEDVLVKPTTRSVWVDGVKGWDFTLNRVHVVGGVDNVKIHGDNVTIQNSLLESTDYFASDPNQGGGETHNDNVQILKGDNLVLAANTIRDTTNFTILGGAEQANVTLDVSNNWLDGGHCTVKLQNKKTWTQKTTLTGNKFGPNRKISKCVVQAHTNVDVTASNNKFEQTALPVSIFWNNA